MTESWIIRPPLVTDAAALADLKIEWSQPDSEPGIAERAGFAHHLSSWMTEQGESLECRIAVLDGRLVGMAWLAVYERVPNFGRLRRQSADLQSVYVVPHLRGRGIGSALVHALCEQADARGIPRITVQSRFEASALYLQAGFVDDHNLLVRSRS